MNKDAFILKAQDVGWQKPLVESVIDICGGFDEFLMIVEEKSRNIYRRIVSIKFNSDMSPSELSDSRVILRPLTEDLDIDTTTEFYKRNHTSIELALSSSCVSNQYDREIMSKHLAPIIPQDFFLHLAKGHGADIIEGGYDYKIPASDICHHLTLYVICLMIYEFYNLSFFA